MIVGPRFWPKVFLSKSCVQGERPGHEDGYDADDTSRGLLLNLYCSFRLVLFFGTSCHQYMICCTSSSTLHLSYKKRWKTYLLCCVTEKKPFVRVSVERNVKVIKKCQNENCHLSFWHLYAILNNSSVFNFHKHRETENFCLDLLESELRSCFGLRNSENFKIRLI